MNYISTVVQKKGNIKRKYWYGQQITDATTKGEGEEDRVKNKEYYLIADYIEKELV